MQRAARYRADRAGHPCPDGAAGILAPRPVPALAPPLVRVYLPRAVVLWAGARGVFVLAMFLSGDPDVAQATDADPFPTGGAAAVAIVPLAAALALVDRRQRGERALLENLGVGPASTALVAAGVALGAEAACVAARAVLAATAAGGAP